VRSFDERIKAHLHASTSTLGCLALVLADSSLMALASIDFYLSISVLRWSRDQSYANKRLSVYFFFKETNER
jgi:hypothetical protein